MKDLRPLALTMGEPAGIGGEIALKAWLERNNRHIPPFYRSQVRRDRKTPAL